jgi:hypothetical protein
VRRPSVGEEDPFGGARLRPQNGRRDSTIPAWKHSCELSGETVSGAASAADVPLPTASDWLRTRGFLDALDQIRTETYAIACSFVANLHVRALRILSEQMNSLNKAARLQAAGVILQSLTR